MRTAFPPPLRALPLLLALLAPAAAQQGDVPGEEQPPLPAHLAVPPAVVRTPREALELFALPPGLRIELAAAEPLVEDPVQAVFDEDGRLWVCEMRGYMPDAEGRGEHEPVGVIAVLEDADGDGRFERRTEFLSGLVLPRGVAPVRGGALVLAPPELLFAEDTDGDGRADRITVVDRGLGGRDNPEHAVNGLLFGLDNAYWCANHPWRYRFGSQGWTRLPTAGGGQWGIARDDLGRILFNTNSEALRGDAYASWYAIRNPNHGRASGVNETVVEDQRVFPARVTPGVNRGYRPGFLHEGYLVQYTAACGPLVYREALLPAEYHGNAFVCEPSANLVARYALLEDANGRLRGEPRRARHDFLSSTDERFRPVNLFPGPDGALYVVDFYRGILQHRIFLTTFLRKQIEERGLDQPTGLGRIWRIVPDGERPAPAPPRLSEASWEELAELLAHPGGWWRDQAQRLFVEDGEGSRAARAALESALASAEALARLHALWALEGAGLLRREHVLAGLADPDPRVRHEALRVGETSLTTGEAQSTARALEVGREPGRLRRQALLSLGEARSAAGDAALAELMSLDAGSPELRSAALSGLLGRELEFLRRLLEDERWREPAAGRDTFVRLLARCVAREGSGERVEGVLDAALEGTRPAWQRAALLAGLVEGRPIGPDGKPAPIRLAHEPARFAELAEDGDTREIRAALAWPGRPGFALAKVEPLDAEQTARFERGRELYAAHCASCHLASGQGEAGKAPPLRHTPYVLGSPERLIRIVTGGLIGPIEVLGSTWDLEMPAHALDDDEVAAVLTYLRRAWGHGAPPIAPADVRRVRSEPPLGRPFTAADLERAEESAVRSER